MRGGYSVQPAEKAGAGHRTRPWRGLRCLATPLGRALGSSDDRLDGTLLHTGNPIIRLLLHIWLSALVPGACRDGLGTRNPKLMSAPTFIQLQITQIRRGGRPVVVRKLERALRISLKLPLYALAVPPAIVIRLIRPWFLIRLGGLISSRIGHFTANTELYLCERDAGINLPKRCHVDLFYMAKPICNQQLATMWKRVLRLWPSWILAPINRVNRLIPGGAVHKIGDNTQHDRDVHNLLDRFPPHLEFTPEEESRGEAGRQTKGIPRSTPFDCLN